MNVFEFMTLKNDLLCSSLYARFEHRAEQDGDLWKLKLLQKVSLGHLWNLFIFSVKKIMGHWVCGVHLYSQCWVSWGRIMISRIDYTVRPCLKIKQVNEWIKYVCKLGIWGQMQEDQISKGDYLVSLIPAWATWGPIDINK